MIVALLFLGHSVYRVCRPAARRTRDTGTLDAKLLDVTVTRVDQ